MLEEFDTNPFNVRVCGNRWFVYFFIFSIIAAIALVGIIHYVIIQIESEIDSISRIEIPKSSKHDF